jgi:NAD-dependent SIR2 family protein deacetylase
MNRSAAIVLVCIIAIVGSAAWIVLRPKSPAAKAKAESERRKCFYCGYEWRKDRGALIRESKNAPPGYQFVVQCPKCKAWAGMAVVHCEKCGKDYTRHSIVKNEDGTLSFPKLNACPYCGAPIGGGTDEAPPETE